MAYKLTTNNFIIRIRDGTFIPMNVANRDYKEYLRWVSMGNSPQNADPSHQSTWSYVRNKRDQLLENSDWTQVGDAPLNALKKQNWADYRTQLRSIPQTFLTVSGVVWPTEPA